MKKYLVYLSIMCFGGTGDVLLKRGMQDLGPVSLHNWTMLVGAVLNPWIAIGICCLIGFFSSYLTALSWDDLTYVLPSTAFGYVVIAFLSRFFLHENVSPWRWAGVLLISCGVGWVTRGPSKTKTQDDHSGALHQREEQHELV